MLMDWLKKAPTAVVVTVIVTCGVLALSVLAAFVFLEARGVDTTAFRQWVNTVGQVLVFPLLGVTAVGSVAAARSASNAEDQTNGQLTAKEAELTRLRTENAQLRASAATDRAVSRD